MVSFCYYCRTHSDFITGNIFVGCVTVYRLMKLVTVNHFTSLLMENDLIAVCFRQVVYLCFVLGRETRNKISICRRPFDNKREGSRSGRLVKD